MYTSETKRAVRIGTSAFIAAALALGTTGVAFADGSHSNGHSDHHHSNKGHHNDIDAVITGVGTNSFTAQVGSASPVFTTTGATTYYEGSTAVTAAALALGERVDVLLTSTSPQTVVKVTIDLSTFEGKVTALNGNVLTITGPANTTRTVDVTPTTTYAMGGSASTLGAIVVGSQIAARGPLGPTSSTLTALNVRIAAPSVHVSGLVTALGTNTFTLQSGSASPVFTTTGATTYYEGSTAVTAAALALGERVDVLLTSTSPQTVVKVTIDLSTFEGKVTALNGNVLTITGPANTTRTVDVTPTTTYAMGGSASTLGAIVVGSQIAARGPLGPTSSTLTALNVRIAAPSVHVSGLVTALGTNTFTLQSGSASPVFTTTGATTYYEGSTAVTAAALALGERVDVLLTSTSPQTVVKVTIDLSTFEGKVTALNGNVLTITGPANTTRTVDVTPTTTYAMGGSASTLGAIVVGSQIAARGPLGPTSSTLTALNVRIAVAHHDHGDHNHHGGRSHREH